MHWSLWCDVIKGKWSFVLVDDVSRDLEKGKFSFKSVIFTIFPINAFRSWKFWPLIAQFYIWFTQLFEWNLYYWIFSVGAIANTKSVSTKLKQLKPFYKKNILDFLGNDTITTKNSYWFWEMLMEDTRAIFFHC